MGGRGLAQNGFLHVLLLFANRGHHLFVRWKFELLDIAALPFLLEALVTAVLGVALAAGALWGFMEFVVKRQLAVDLSFIPWVGTHDYLLALIAIAILGPLLTLVPTLVLTRKYLKV